MPTTDLAPPVFRVQTLDGQVNVLAPDGRVVTQIEANRKDAQPLCDRWAAELNRAAKAGFEAGRKSLAEAMRGGGAN